MDREALTRDRSVARCIAEGYRLFSSQQLTTLRRTWKPLVASSLGWALTVTTALSGQWIGTGLALLLAQSEAVTPQNFPYVMNDKVVYIDSDARMAEDAP